MSACAEFRALLEDSLAGARGSLADLARHAHVDGCENWRAELARERALDGLLERVPPPVAPTLLARRILASLAEERARPPQAEGASGDDSVEYQALEELLDELPEPRVPADLSARVLAGVAHARAPRASPGRRTRWLLAAAAALLAAVGLWAWNARRAGGARLEVAQGEALDLEADAELLAYAVERWELLHDEDLDVWLASLDPLDELLLEYADDETWPEEGEANPTRAEGD